MGALGTIAEKLNSSELQSNIKRVLEDDYTTYYVLDYLAFKAAIQVIISFIIICVFVGVALNIRTSQLNRLRNQHMLSPNNTDIISRLAMCECKVHNLISAKIATILACSIGSIFMMLLSGFFISEAIDDRNIATGNFSYCIVTETGRNESGNYLNFKDSNGQELNHIMVYSSDFGEDNTKQWLLIYKKRSNNLIKAINMSCFD